MKTESENSFWSKYAILALSQALNEGEAVQGRIESVIKFKLRRALLQKQTEPWPENVFLSDYINDRPSHAGRLGRLEPPHFFSFLFFCRFSQAKKKKQKDIMIHSLYSVFL